MAHWDSEEDEALPARRPLRRARKRSVWFVVLLVCLGTCGGCGVLGTLGYFFFVHDIEEPMTEADKAVVLTIKDLLPFAPALNLQQKSETFKRARHLDGSRDFEYEFENADDADDTLYLYSSAGFETSAQDAEGVYMMTTPAVKIGLALTGKEGPTAVDRNDLFRWGDESKCMLLVQGNVTVGNYFVARKGSKVFSVLVIGVFFDKPETLRRLLTPVLERFEKHTP
jgi:hypothetical protein